MARRVVIAGVLSLCALVQGCSDDGGPDLATIEAALEGCARDSASALLQILSYYDQVIRDATQLSVITGPDVQVDPSTNPADPPNTFLFTVAYDSNGNGILDSAIKRVTRAAGSPR